MEHAKRKRVGKGGGFDESGDERASDKRRALAYVAGAIGVGAALGSGVVGRLIERAADAIGVTNVSDQPTGKDTTEAAHHPAERRQAQLRQFVEKVNRETDEGEKGNQR